MLKRCEGETTRRSTKEKATQITEWLFRGLKSVLAHVFEHVCNFFWPLILPAIYAQLLELIHQHFM